MAKMLLVMACLALVACDAPAAFQYRPPIALTHDLKPGEKVVCDNWFVIIGIPLGDFPLFYYRRHHFECVVKQEK
jgi:hypothetical protein